MKDWSSSRTRELYRRNRALIWLCVVIFVSELGFGSIVPAVPLFARSFGVSQAAIGLTLAVYGLARFLINVPSGQLADRIGRRWTLVLGEVLTVVGNLLCGFSGSFEQFLIFRFLAGAGASMVITCGQVILADLATLENRGRMMSIFHGVFMLGVGFGPLPGGFLAQQFGLSVPFFAFAGLSVIAAVIAFDRVPETRGIRERHEATTAPTAAQERMPLIVQLRAVFSQIGFVLVSLVTFAQFFARTGLVFAVVPVMVAIKMDATPDQIGTALAVVSLTNVAMVYAAGALVDRLGRKPVIVPATLLSAGAIASFAIAPDYLWLLSASVLWGVASGICGAPPAAYAADVAPPGMNAITMGSFRTVADFGYVVGPLLGGWMADVFSNEVALYATGLLFLLSGTLFALFAPETGGRRPGALHRVPRHLPGRSS